MAGCALVAESACTDDAFHRVLRNLYETVCLDDPSFANMLAGHMAMLVLTCLIFISASMGPALNGTLTVASVLFNIFMNALELLVAFIQAYVFTMLSAVFIGLAQEGAKVKAE